MKVKGSGTAEHSSFVSSVEVIGEGNRPSMNGLLDQMDYDGFLGGFYIPLASDIVWIFLKSFSVYASNR